MPAQDRAWLLRHLDEQARYLALLTDYAADNVSDADILLRVRDEVFTLRETLDTLGVPDALISNGAWHRVPHAEHRAAWPSAAEARPADV